MRSEHRTSNIEHRTSKWLAAAFALFAFAACCGWAEEETSVIVVVGAGGEAEYATAFEKSAVQWKQAGEAGGATERTIGLDEHSAQSLEQLRTALRAEPKDGATELWIVLLGHGNADGRDAKFNLTGDDLSAAEFAELLAPFHRPLVLINCFSASGAFLAPLAAPGRLSTVTAALVSQRSPVSCCASRFSAPSWRPP